MKGKERMMAVLRHEEIDQIPFTMYAETLKVFGLFITDVLFNLANNNRHSKTLNLAGFGKFVCHPISMLCFPRMGIATPSYALSDIERLIVPRINQHIDVRFAHYLN